MTHGIDVPAVPTAAVPAAVVPAAVDVIAIDGGNSKTEVLVVSRDGVVLGRSRGPGASPQNVGVAGCVTALEELVREALPADPPQSKSVFGIPRLVEEFDRMSPEGGRDRRAVGAKLFAQIRVFADKGIDKLERSTLLRSLAFYKRPQHREVERIACKPRQ